ncbi:hypothetical protein C8R41DRAFT_921285 [Lentinula lateritia]|uniref:Uncharacterized protein n=1 Tax=Lentinula lateritia TaxID=40482 RepID=A0ABQ8VBP8_9AGAR|nr:hypothetical protein C8R41DRAFT_921285 [Lentinula lateritia]
MDWPVACPSFRLSLSYILPPFTLLTLGVPYSSINHGAAAAAGSLSSLIAAFHDLDPDYLAVVRTTLDSQQLALSLLEMQCQQVLDAMDIDGSSGDSPTAIPSEEIEIDGQQFKIVYPSEPQPSDTLVLPGTYEKDTGVFYATYRDLNSLKRTALIEICKKYSLTTQGNMQVLKEKIVGFSENKIRWQCLIPAARRAHRGVRDGGITKNKPKLKEATTAASAKVKKLKLSTVRRNELMGLPLDAPLGVQLFDTNRSKDLRTLEQKNSLLRWAKMFCDKHPYVTREELARRRKIKDEERARENATSTAKVAEYMHSMIEHVSNLRAEIQTLKTGFPQPRSALCAQLPASHSIPSCSPPAPYNASSPAASPYTSLTANSILLSKDRSFDGGLLACVGGALIPTPFVDNGVVAVNGSSGSSTLLTNRPSSELEKVYVITIGFGKIVRFKESELSEPPSITFATNISRLDRVWDDERPNWDPEDCGKRLLSINGIPIALRYWRGVFSGKKSSVWASLKKIWSEWKYVAERYRASSPVEFWKEFSFVDGRRFHWKAISDHLRNLRSEHEQQLVDQAKAEYGLDFAKIFVNNKGKVLTDKSAIARHYVDKLANRLE